jgi:uncharacterized protein YggU (UPF0235/DUF167 family)
MKITVRAKLNRKKEGVEEGDDGVYVVWTTKPAVDNKANEDICLQLARHFDVPKSAVAVIAGHSAKTKIVEVRGK